VEIMVCHIIPTVLHFTGGYRMPCLPSACSNQSYTRSRFCALPSSGCSLDSCLVFGLSLSIQHLKLMIRWMENKSYTKIRVNTQCCLLLPAGAVSYARGARLSLLPSERGILDLKFAI